MSKRICCVNDMPGVGKIALSAMIPILSAKGIDTTCLPTALVSNTLDHSTLPCSFKMLTTIYNLYLVWVGEMPVPPPDYKFHEGSDHVCWFTAVYTHKVVE